jgi:Mg2+ and Co2+ transporter CorA
MQITTSHQQKIERLEAERRQIEDRLRRMKRAAQTAERKKQTRAKIILGALVLRDHQKLLPQLIALASPQDAELLRSAFPSVAKEAPATAASRL